MSITVSSSEEDEVISTINTTPLVDVMLVLLIIFLITIPVVTTSIDVALPKERVEIRETKPENIIISVDAKGSIYWYERQLSGQKELIALLKQSATQKPQPEVQIRGDLSATYTGAGTILYACQVAGIGKVAFITEPPSLN